MRMMIAVLALAVSGCAMTPVQLREEGLRSQHTLKLPPMEAAACVARNIEESSRDSIIGKFQSGVRPGRVKGEAELLAYTMEFNHMVADLSPKGGGSVANVWTSSRLLDSLQKRLSDSFKGC